MSEPPVRVCYVISHFHPFASGAERQALAPGVELVRRGHSAHVVTQAVAGQPRDETIRGVRVHRWVEPSQSGPLFGISFVAGVIRALRRLRPRYDLIHTHQGLWEAIATGLGRAGFGGAPTLVQPASSGYYGEAEELARTRGSPILRRLILRNSGFAAISADIERQWRALGVPAERMTRMASGVDADRFHPGRGPCRGDLPPRPRVIFTGRLHPQKNLDLLLDAWPAVAGGAGAHLLLVGEGPDRDRLEARARARGLVGSVHFLGAVEDPAGLLREADAFVLPSVAEGMSNSLLEAMASGLASIVSDIGGNRDLIVDGQTGRLLPGDREAWASALVSAIPAPVVAEGRFDTPELVAEAFRRGAHAVVVGTAITNPREITRRFVQATQPGAS
jgi:glycosyltransferase involved in cell wall biosynthesis